MDKQSPDTKRKDQDPATPGPTTGGMGSMGPQPDEPTLEEKLGVDDAPHDEATKGQREEPRQTHGARQGPPPAHEERTSASDDATVPHAPDNRGSTDKDLDHERPAHSSTELKDETETRS